MKFVLFHGAFGSPEGNWFPELKEKLEGLGQTVIVPRFPVENFEKLTKAGPKSQTKNQTLDNWLSVLSEIAKTFRKDEKLCFIGHSLGPLFILHAVSRFNLKLDSAIFVSPFMDRLANDEWQFDKVNSSFYKTDFNFARLKKLIPVSYVLYSDNDPYVDKNCSILFAKALDSSLILVRKAGHMNSEVNLNEFPLVLDLCLTRLDLDLFQRYLMLQKKTGAIGYITSTKSGSVIKLNAQQALDEGVFRFRHLQKTGFCTFFSGITASFWHDPKSKYMEGARAAAKRIKDFTRVFVIEKPSHLKNKPMREQIKLDLEAGIKVFFCPFEKIKGKIPEPDFGIWDNSYVCIVPSPKNRKVNTIELNNDKAALKMAETWKREVLKNSSRIHNLDDDIEKFIKDQYKR